jgi:hypothetical protein
MCVRQLVFGTMCRNMDINWYHKQHHKIREQFRHDIIMSKIKQREDKLFRNMFIKISLIITAIVLLVTVVF